jgi:hypothetical protein
MISADVLMRPPGDQVDDPLYLRISPALRRSAYYVLASAVPLAIVAFWVAGFVWSLSGN